MARNLSPSTSACPAQRHRKMAGKIPRRLMAQASFALSVDAGRPLRRFFRRKRRFATKQNAF